VLISQSGQIITTITIDNDHVECLLYIALPTLYCQAAVFGDCHTYILYIYCPTVPGSIHPKVGRRSLRHLRHPSDHLHHQIRHNLYVSAFPIDSNRRYCGIGIVTYLHKSLSSLAIPGSIRSTRHSANPFLHSATVSAANHAILSW
jgi:hypothetical protein